MTNYAHNRLTIGAPLADVTHYLLRTDGDWFFNMHELFPLKVPADDPTGKDTYTFAWWDKTTGTKSVPHIHNLRGPNETSTVFEYQTASVPNIYTIERLHRLTGRPITLEFKNRRGNFEGTYTCRESQCVYEDRPIPPATEFDTEFWSRC